MALKERPLSAEQLDLIRDGACPFCREIDTESPTLQDSEYQEWGWYSTHRCRLCGKQWNQVAMLTSAYAFEIVKNTDANTDATPAPAGKRKG